MRAKALRRLGAVAFAAVSASLLTAESLRRARVCVRAASAVLYVCEVSALVRRGAWAAALSLGR